MKYIIIVLLSLTSIIGAQVNNTGTIRFVYNKEVVELPVTSVSMIKQDKIRLAIRCEKNNDKVMQLANLEFELKSFAPNKESNLMLMNAQIIMADLQKDLKRDLSIAWSGKEYQGYLELSKAKEANWKYYRESVIGGKYSFTISSCKIADNKIVINGSFEISAIGILGFLEHENADKSDDSPKKLELKEGSFEIII